MESKYKLTLHKKSYLLTGISRDDPNKEKVKQEIIKRKFKRFIY